jgi:hypothetical protein
MDDAKTFKSRDQKTVNVSFNRIMFVVDTQASDGNNVFAMLTGKKLTDLLIKKSKRIMFLRYLCN